MTILHKWEINIPSVYASFMKVKSDVINRYIRYKVLFPTLFDIPLDLRHPFTHI